MYHVIIAFSLSPPFHRRHGLSLSGKNFKPSFFVPSSTKPIAKTYSSKSASFRVVASFHLYFRCPSPLTCPVVTCPCGMLFCPFYTSAFALVFPLFRKLQSTLHMARGLSVDGLQNSCPVIAASMCRVPRAYPFARVRFLCPSVSNIACD